MKKKLVVLDPLTQITYVFDYDTGIFEDAFECIIAHNEEFELKINVTNCDFMEVNEFNLKFL